MKYSQSKFVALIYAAVIFCSCSKREVSLEKQDANVAENEPQHSAQQKVVSEYSDAIACTDGPKRAIYFMLGETGIEIPNTARIKYEYIGPALSGDSDHLAGSTRRGCEGDPIRATAIDFSKSVAVLLPQFSQVHPDGIEYLSIVHIDNPKIWIQSALLEERFRQMNDSGKCYTTAHGIWTCEGQDGYAIFRSPEETGEGPYKHYWVAECSTWPSRQPSVCAVRSRISGEVGIYYRFNRDRIQIDQMYQSDGYFRAEVAKLIARKRCQRHFQEQECL